MDKKSRKDKDISKNTLKQIDKSAENFKKGNVGKPIKPDWRQHENQIK